MCLHVNAHTTCLRIKYIIMKKDEKTNIKVIGMVKLGGGRQRQLRALFSFTLFQVLARYHFSQSP